jgi:hypothetical protein
MGELLFKPPAETRVRTFVGRFLRRLPALVFATVARLLVVTFTILILAPTRIFVPEAILLEGASFGKAMGRSGALARNRGGFCLGVWLAAVFLPAVGAISLDLLGNALTHYVFQLGYPTGELFETAAPASRCWARCWRCRWSRRSASSVTSTCARARKAGTSSCGSSRSPSRAPCCGRRAA